MPSVSVPGSGCMGCGESVVYVPVQAAASVPFIGIILAIAVFLTIVMIGSHVGLILFPILALVAHGNNDIESRNKYILYFVVSLIVVLLLVWLNAAVVASNNRS